MTQSNKPGAPVKSQAAKAPSVASRKKAGPAAAAEAAKRLSKMTPEEQAAELFRTMVASSGKKSW